MKKIVFLSIICLLPVVSAAQATCEKRVDAHQKATTLQRVSYCLTPDYSAPDNANAGLVFSGVSAHYPVETQPATSQRPTSREGYFKPKEVSVSQTYVGTTQFPQIQQGPAGQLVVANDTVVTPTGSQSFEYVPSPTVPEITPVQQPAAPIVAAPVAPVVTNDEFTYVSSPTVPSLGGTVQTPAQTASSVTLPTAGPVEHFMADEVDANGQLLAPRAETQATVSETRAGVKARQAKPQRRNVAATVQPTPASTEPAPYTYEEDLTQPYGQTEIPVGTQSYAPASYDNGDEIYEEIPVGTQSYAPATAN